MGASIRHLRGEGIRWRIAHLLNRLPWTCWTNLVCWAIDGRRPDTGYVPGFKAGLACRADLDACGVCYCGKLRTPALEYQFTCTGRPDCESAKHIHGCHADTHGVCDEPDTDHGQPAARPARKETDPWT